MKYHKRKAQRLVSLIPLAWIVFFFFYTYQKFKDMTYFPFFLIILGAVFLMTTVSSLVQSVSVQGHDLIYRSLFRKKVVDFTRVSEIKESNRALATQTYYASRRGSAIWNLEFVQDQKSIIIPNIHSFKDYEGLYKEIEHFSGKKIKKREEVLKERAQNPNKNIPKIHLKW